jgi:hypothetical protein
MLSEFGSAGRLATARNVGARSASEKEKDVCLTNRAEPQVAASLFQQLAAFGVALGGPQKKAHFFVASIAGIFAESPEIRFEWGPIPTPPRAAPFKKF